MSSQTSKQLTLFLIIFISFWFFLQYTWLARDNTPPAWDSAAHAEKVFEFVGSSIDGSSDNGLQWHVLYGSSYPPLYYILASPSVLFGKHVDVIVFWMSFINGFILLLAFNDLAKRNKSSSFLLFSIPIILSYPYLIMMLRECTLDFLLGVSVFVSFWRFIVWHEERTLANSIFLGISFGFGMLVKWSYFGYGLLPGYLFFVISSTTDGQINLKERMRQFIAVTISSIAITVPWYLISFSEYFQHVQNALSILSDYDGINVGISTAGLLFYLKGLFFGQMGGIVIPGLLIVLGVFFYILTEQKHKLLTASWAIFMFLFLMLIPGREFRFAIPFILLVAYMAGLGYAKLKSKWIKISVFLILICWSTSNLLIQSFIGGGVNVRWNSFELFGTKNYLGGDSIPETSPFLGKTILSDIINFHESENLPTVLMLCDSQRDNINTYKYQAHVDGHMISFWKIDHNKDERIELMWKANEFDFVVYQDPKTYDHYSAFKERVREKITELKRMDQYEEVKNYTTFFGDDLLLFRKR